jgi:hypothetical protein
LAAFFAAFFAGFFAAAFFAAFLVAICLFSLFDGLHRFCNCYIAVEECIESRSIDVKKKTSREWKKEQQFFSTRNWLDVRIGVSKVIESHSMTNMQWKIAMRAMRDD